MHISLCFFSASITTLSLFARCSWGDLLEVPSKFKQEFSRASLMLQSWFSRLFLDCFSTSARLRCSKLCTFLSASFTLQCDFSEFPRSSFLSVRSHFDYIPRALSCLKIRSFYLLTSYGNGYLFFAVGEFGELWGNVFFNNSPSLNHLF